MSEIRSIEAYQKTPKCGEIWMCNLDNKGGSIQTGYRPVYILSNDKNNAFSPTLNVIPLTSKASKRRLPMHVFLCNYACYGLKKPSTLLIEQITTVSTDRVDLRLGEINDRETLMQIYQAMEIQFPIMAMFTKLASAV